MGGNVAGLYASLFPEVVQKLVLLDAAGMPLIRQDWKGKAFFKVIYDYNGRKWRLTP